MMAKPLHIQIIVGTTREGRASRPVADWVAAVAARREDMTVELVDLKDWPLPLFDLPVAPRFGNYTNELQRKWAASVANADGFIFIVPEYNHGYPAALKNAIDYLDAEWRRKPAAFVGLGNVFGARAIEQLSLVLIELRMVPLAQTIRLDTRSNLVDGIYRGVATDENALALMLDELSWWASVLADARNTAVAEGNHRIPQRPAKK